MRGTGVISYPNSLLSGVDIIPGELVYGRVNIIEITPMSWFLY
jgi:hypothetical protein